MTTFAKIIVVLQKMRVVTISVAIIVFAWMILWLVNAHFPHRVRDEELATEGHPTVDQMVRLLNSSDKIVLNNTLTRFEFSGSDAGKERAAELLQNNDLYVWYCASLYLGAIGDQRSVPYLIRGLDHPAWRSRPRLLQYLKKLTQQDLGEDKNEWIKWWQAQHPGQSFDFATRKP